MFIIVLIIYKVIYKELYLSTFDSNSAKILGVNTKLINFIFTLLSGIAISIAAKTIGSLIVSSLLVIPVISAMQFSRSYKDTLVISIVLSILYIYLGLIISYYFNLKPGSVIVLVAAIFLVISFIFKRR